MSQNPYEPPQSDSSSKAADFAWWEVAGIQAAPIKEKRMALVILKSIVFGIAGAIVGFFGFLLLTIPFAEALGDSDALLAVATVLLVLSTIGGMLCGVHLPFSRLPRKRPPPPRIF